MRNLLYKELRLALHPSVILFLFLPAMLLIPHYPYLIIFFYTCLGIFFLSITGRENNDIYYTLQLPVRKREIVGARFLLVVLIQILQFIIAIPFAIANRALITFPNEAGMNANVAFFGFAFLILGLFNLVFLTMYYKNPNKVGIPFLVGCLTFVVAMFAIEASRFIFPFVQEYLNPMGTEHLGYQLIALFAGIVLWALFTFLAYKKSVKSFEAFDL